MRKAPKTELQNICRRGKISNLQQIVGSAAYPTALRGLTRACAPKARWRGRRQIREQLAGYFAYGQAWYSAAHQHIYSITDLQQRAIVKDRWYLTNAKRRYLARMEALKKTKEGTSSNKKRSGNRNRRHSEKLPAKAVTKNTRAN